jgi:integrase
MWQMATMPARTSAQTAMDTPTNQLIIISSDRSPDPHTRRELAIAAWLAEKAELSQSLETRRAYAAMLERFRQTLALAELDLDASYQQVALVAQAFAAAGRVRAATHNRRLAILSSFYTHAIERGLLDPPNPIDTLRRRRVQPYRAARALDTDVVRRGLNAIDRATLAGARDYALLSVAIVTGRRVSELAGLRMGDVETTDHGRLRLTWRRTKGDETHVDLLPPRISAALRDYLDLVYDVWEQEPPPADAAVWASVSHHHGGGPISSQAIADICQRHLKTSKVHRLRHTFAYTMEQHGAKISEIQRKLGHKSIATTSLYLQALRSEENPYAEAIEQAIGVEERA